MLTHFWRINVKNCNGLAMPRMSLTFALVAVIVTLPLSMTWGQQMPEPSAVIAIAPVDEQLKDFEYLATATSEQMGAMSGLLKYQVDGYLTGVDQKRPAGAILYFKEGSQEPDSVAFFPVTEYGDVIDKISEYAEIDEDGEFVSFIPDNGQQLFITQKSDYAFVSDKSDLLKKIPADPGSLIGEQAKKYNLSARIFPQRIPQELRDQAIQWIRESYEETIDMMDDLQADFQQMQLDNNIQQIEMAVNEVETLTVGLKADKATQRIYFDLNLKCKSGSKFAGKLATSKKSAPTQFAGFLMDKAAFTMHNCSGVDKEDAERIVKTLVSSRDMLIEERQDSMDEVEIEALTKLSDKVIDSIGKTMKTGTLDMGGFAFTNDGLNAVFGGILIDATGLEATIKEIVNDTKDKLDGDQLAFNLNSGSHGGFNLHEITVNLPEEEFDDSLMKIIGDRVNIVLGIGKDKAYAAIGKDPVSSLKKAIDANASGSSKRPEIIGQYNIFIAPIMNLVAEVADEPLVEDMRHRIEEVGRDRIRVTYDVKNDEMVVRSEMQDGILQLLGAFAEAMQGGMGGADF